MQLREDNLQSKNGREKSKKSNYGHSSLLTSVGLLCKVHFRHGSRSRQASAKFTFTGVTTYSRSLSYRIENMRWQLLEQDGYLLMLPGLERWHEATMKQKNFLEHNKTRESRRKQTWTSGIHWKTPFISDNCLQAASLEMLSGKQCNRSEREHSSHLLHRQHGSKQNYCIPLSKVGEEIQDLQALTS